MKKQEQILTREQQQLINRRKHSDYSKAEKIIGNYLGSNGIEFYTEFFFKEMNHAGKRKLLFFDFYIPDYNLCIEFDGLQHYTRKFNGRPLPNGEVNDFLKNAFCKKKGLHLLRIKYTDIENIESIICKKFDELETKSPHKK